jgi:glycine C-acetyltransferase
MYGDLRSIVKNELGSIREQSLYKEERVLQSPQGREITIDGKKLLNFCSNNYLGLSGTPALQEASDAALQRWGFGLASVRFICGTQGIHKELEAATAAFLGMEDVVLYSSCFERLIFKHMDMVDLEEKLQSVADKRLKVIATDGVFSMDGHIAPLAAICDLADKYGALVMVDDAHGVGVLGEHSKGAPELTGTIDRIDFLTGTYGKALGGAGGAYIATHTETAEFLRQRSRTYLFSNALDTGIAGAALFAIDHIQKHPELRQRLYDNTKYFRNAMKQAGFTVSESEHPITPVMFAEEQQAVDTAKALFDAGIFVVGFSYPVVPKGKARIRVQVSAAHTTEDLSLLVQQFAALTR